MTNTRFAGSIAVLVLWLCAPPVSVVHAEKIPLRVQIGDRTLTIPGYDSSGVMYVSMKDFASALTLPYAISAERRKLEVRLPNHRVKATSGSAFVVVTDVSTDISSVYQMTHNVFVRDSLYFAPASELVALLDRLSPLGVTLNAETRSVTKEAVTGEPTFDITGLSIESRLNGYLLTIAAPRKLGSFDAFLSHDGWLYVTINDAQADTVALSKFKGGDAIRRVLVFQSPTYVQLTFQVSPEITQVDPMVDGQSSNLLISLLTRTDLPREEPAAKKPEVKLKEEEARSTHQPARNRPKLDVIVIDAGHGGKDPGTIGVAGTREKDVALGVALKLGQLIRQNLKDVRIVYTRRNDTFVELRNRTKIANDSSGKLFVSIHCNSTERKPSSANGFEIYILRPGKTESAIRIAEQENDAIKFEDDYKSRYQQLTEENFILITMRQSAFVRYSEEFAAKASDEMAKFLKIQNSGVKQAGFLVLVGASMPNVLVETGYLSNRQEEKFLRSQEGQRKIAEALLEGIRQYKSRYEEAPQENHSRSGTSN